MTTTYQLASVGSIWFTLTSLTHLALSRWFSDEVLMGGDVPLMAVVAGIYAAVCLSLVFDINQENYWDTISYHLLKDE